MNSDDKGARYNNKKEQEIMDLYNEFFDNLQIIFQQIHGPDGRSMALAKTHLETSAMYAIRSCRKIVGIC